MTPRMRIIEQHLMSDEVGMITKGLDEQAKTLRRVAGGRKYGGPAFADKRAQLRRVASRYEALAREFEATLVPDDDGTQGK